MAGNITKIETLSFGNDGDLRGVILDFFDIDIRILSQEKLRALNELCEWMKQSIIWVKKEKRWKYKNMEKGEMGSFTFPLSGEMSLSHLLHGGDTNVPYLQFDFDAFERGMKAFIQKLGISFEDKSLIERDVINKFALDASRLLEEGDHEEFFRKISEGGSYIENNPRSYRSSYFELLERLGLDYGSDDEGYTEIPIQYINL